MLEKLRTRKGEAEVVMEEGGSGGRGFRVGETKEQEVEVGGQDRREKMRKREKRKER